MVWTHRGWHVCLLLIPLVWCEASEKDASDPHDAAQTRSGDGAPQAAAEGLSLDGAWDEEKADAVLAETLRLRIETDISGLTGPEKLAVTKLLEVGRTFHGLYEESRHAEAPLARRRLQTLHEQGHAKARTGKLLDLYRIFQGPIATTPDNERVAFLPVAPESEGRNVYPAGVTRAELDGFLEQHPEARSEILHVRTVVRRTTAEALSADLKTLEDHPVLSALHPDLELEWRRLRDDASRPAFYAVPYSVAYAQELLRAHDLLREASRAMAETDGDFAAYLALRALDLLTNDYEAGDAAWVTGRFGRLNAAIGSYETYDDKLYGVKSFFGLSLLLQDAQRTRALDEALQGIQALEDRLPYGPRKRVSAHIPVGAYAVIADFGQSRGTNTASILPNEPAHSRKYGRTVLLRTSTMLSEELFDLSKRKFAAAVADAHADDLTMEGQFQRTLWHEIGHYLGPDTTRAGASVKDSLSQYSNLIEEMKSDLCSLYAVPALLAAGHLDADGVRGIYASGIRRVLQAVKPRRDQPYQTMQLMQMNYYLAQGVLSFRDGRLSIDYRKLPATVESLLTEVLQIQLAGDPDRAGELVERWGGWSDDLHGVLAERMRAQAGPRVHLVHFSALGE